MGEGHGCHECTGAIGRLAFGLANRISRRDYLHQHEPHLALGGDCGIDQRAATILPSEIADRYRFGQPSLRPKSSRSQSELGSARTPSGRRDGAICWILGSGYHRNARKQSERGVPASLIVSRYSDRAPSDRFRNSGAGASLDLGAFGRYMYQRIKRGLYAPPTSLDRQRWRMTMWPMRATIGRPALRCVCTRKRASMIDRRHFLIGAGAFLTASFVRRASAFSKKRGRPLILPAVQEPEETLYVYWQAENEVANWRVSLGPDQPSAPPPPE
jgi:hypothetical protein